MKDVIDNPSLTHQDLPIRVPPAKVYGLVGVFVDDLLKSGRKSLIMAVTQKLKKLWKAGEAEMLTPTSSLLFLGVRLEDTPTGLFIHQQSYTRELIKKF
eukprot:5877008-Amphidinium_carterae.1